MCLSPPLHYSQLTSQKIRVTLGRSPSSPELSLSVSLHLSSYFSPITPSSLVGIWRVTLGQFNLSFPSSHSVYWSAAVSCLYIPIHQVVTLFSAPPTSPALLCYTKLSISSFVTLLFFVAQLWLFSVLCLQEGVFKICLLYQGNDCVCLSCKKGCEDLFCGVVFCEIKLVSQMKISTSKCVF